MIIPLLKKSELFSKVSPEEMNVLTPLSQEKTFSTETIIFSQNAPAERVYLLDHGSVALKTVLSNGLEITYEMITKPGDPFGWSALIEPFEHMTTAISLEETGAIVFNRKDLIRIFPQYPLLGFKVMHNLCILLARRLERTRRLLVGQI